MKKILITLILSFVVSVSFAEISMPRIFTDNMVLQADAPNKLWGTSLPNAEVTVLIGDKKVSTKADAKGDWSLKTPTFKKTFTPVEIVVSENGKPQKTLKNILVGEVWVIGGQSNMQWAVRNTTDFENAKKRISSNIRIFKQPSSQMASEPQRDFHRTAGWLVADKNSIPGASAIGYYFAEMISKELKTPVGIVETPLGGTKMITWLPREKIITDVLKRNLAEFDAKQAKYDYEKAKAQFDAKLKKFDDENHGKKLTEKLKEERKNIVRYRPNPQSVWRAQETPCYLYNAKIAPLAGVTARGFLWYQGESDSGRSGSKYFDQTFALLINTWREAWNDKDMPFYFFQLPSFSTMSNWGLIRANQQKVAKEVDKAYMISIIDSGEEKDIHPRDKTFVTKRLFASVMKNTYKNNSFKCEQAEVASVKYADNKAIVKFNTKIVGEGSPRGFEVLVGKKWLPAKAKLISNTSLPMRQFQA